jgi:drug/metabolite transporter (DMT)-like permease
MTGRIAVLTVLTLFAFALNSILCRLALSNHLIDAASFTLVRLASGAAMLGILSFTIRKSSPLGQGSWTSGFLLFAYAAAFSFAYLNLSAGTGGLILFGCVQFTMIGVGVAKGERPGWGEWLGIVVAQIGLVVLVAPGLHAPAPVAALLMAAAGVSWGFYSLRGKTAKDPTLATADNFLKAVPFAILVGAAGLPTLNASAGGIGLAVLSGAVTSGLGYVLWYSVLPHLAATKAAVCQLAVPAIVAILGVVALAEQTTPRFFLASALLLGGVALAVLKKRAPPAAEPTDS